MLNGYSNDLGIPKDVLDTIAMAAMGVLNNEIPKVPTHREPTFSDNMRDWLLSQGIPGIEGELSNHGGGTLG